MGSECHSAVVLLLCWLNGSVMAPAPEMCASPEVAQSQQRLFACRICAEYGATLFASEE